MRRYRDNEMILAETKGTQWAYVGLRVEVILLTFE